MANAITSYLDPRNNAYFGTAIGPEGDAASLGYGDGRGVLDYSSLPGAQGVTVDGVDPQTFAQWLSNNGYRIAEENAGGGGRRYVVDQGGNIVGNPMGYSQDDSAFMTAAMLAGAVVGGAAAGAAGGSGAAAGSAAAPEALGAAGGYGFTSAEAAGAAPAFLGGGGGAAAGSVGATGGATGALGASGAGGSAGGAGMAGWTDWAQLGLGLASSLTQSNAAENAAASQGAATQQAINEQRRQFDLTRGDTAPYREAAIPALQKYAAGVDTPTTAADAMADPGYQWAQQQGQQALDRKFAASGGRISGASMKAASRFNQGNASQFFGAADQRRENRLSRLAALAQIGQSAVNTSANAGAGSANAIGQYMSSQGDANAASQLARGSIWGNQANSIAALYGRQRNQPGYGSPAPSNGYGDGYINVLGDW